MVPNKATAAPRSNMINHAETSKDVGKMSPIVKAYLGHSVALKRLLGKYLSRPEDVDDVAQGAFLRAFAAESRQEIKAPKSFLFTTARNLALSELTKKANKTSDALADFEGTAVLCDDKQLPADKTLEGREKLALFSEAVGHLPPQCRRAFLMRKIDGLPIKEIAVRMGITVSSVEKHLATGLLKCSDYLADRGYTPEDFGRVVRERKDAGLVLRMADPKKKNGEQRQQSGRST